MGRMAIRSRWGFTLVEILIASLVLVLVIVPLIGLLISRRTSGQSAEGMAEAVTFAQDIMERLISNNLPFELIDPGGGSARGKTLATSAEGAVVQAGFVNSIAGGIRGQTYDAAKLEDIVSDEVNGNNIRIKRDSRTQKSYEIFFFAGKYRDRPGIADLREKSITGQDYTRADIDKTLTFVYLDKPAGYGQPYNFTPTNAATFNKQTILQNDTVANTGATSIVANPYTMPPYEVAGGASLDARQYTASGTKTFRTDYSYHDNTTLVDAGYTLIPGWPNGHYINGSIRYDLNDNLLGDQRRIWARTIQELTTAASTGATVKPVVGYHPAVIDQQTFKETHGALMKIVLGVRFGPYEYSTQRKQNASNMREFWLVSFKAKLED
jgi:hypothetical protein